MNTTTTLPNIVTTVVETATLVAEPNNLGNLGSELKTVKDILALVSASSGLIFLFALVAVCYFAYKCYLRVDKITVDKSGVTLDTAPNNSLSNATLPGSNINNDTQNTSKGGQTLTHTTGDSNTTAPKGN